MTSSGVNEGLTACAGSSSTSSRNTRWHCGHADLIRQAIDGATGDDVVVRPATEADADALAAVYRRSSLWNEGDRPNLLDHPEFLVWDVALREGRTLLAEIDGQAVGFATTSDHDDTSELDDLFTDPDWLDEAWRRHSCGNALQPPAAACVGST